jgi:outer membrane protein OmpA-like peptidoglycan-associated protein
LFYSACIFLDSLRYTCQIMRSFFTATFLFLLFSPAFAFGGQKTFTLNDGELDSSSVMRRYDIYFDLGKPTLRPEDSLALDSIAGWIILHPEFIIEVGNHTDYVNPNSSSRITMARAVSVCNYLIAHSVPKEQLLAKGYGDTRKIISEQIVAKELSKAKKDSLHALSRRTEFKIIGVNPKLMKAFLLTDTLFWPGEVLRDERRIMFDLNHSGLRPESKPYLDSIALFLKAHPNLKVEVDAHTDIRGSAQYNDRLSEMRAICIKDYLVSQGIDPLRLRAKGFGESQPIWTEKEIRLLQTKEEKEALYQQNRRIEFKIIKVN